METGGVDEMKKVSYTRSAMIFVSIMVVLPSWCHAMTAVSLKAHMDQGDPVTIVDIRSGSEYALGHIPNAINIPARIITRKPFPSLGRVVVYGDGIQKGIASQAVTALNAKEGLQAELLEGGFAAWESMDFPSTERHGIKRERFKYIAYKELQQAVKHNQDIVLVDMRSPGEVEKTSGTDAGTITGDTRSNLSEKFPGLKIITLDGRDPQQSGDLDQVSIAGLANARGKGHETVFVLVGSGDGLTEKVARRLRASGMRSVCILTGGEKILKRDGRPGFGTHVAGD